MDGKGIYRSILPIIILLYLSLTLNGQDINYDSLLQRVDTVENPVYKPVLSVGYGTLNFMGDVRNSYRWPVIGNPAARVNISTFIDNSNYFTAYFSFLTGNLNGDQQLKSESEHTLLNFSTNIYSIGVAVSYGFGHFIPEDIPVRPYVMLGAEQLSFSAKGDLKDAEGRFYHMWPDGSLRSIPPDGVGPAIPLSRDYRYETDLRNYERTQYSLGSYSNRTIGFPAELGIRMDISDRVFLSLGTSWHYILSDYIDNVAAEGTHIQGNKGNDSYMYTHATLHFDLFSDPETRTEDLLFADIEFDTLFYADEDGDFILDNVDECPGTPYGVVTDTLGCPLDTDADGVPDYLDKEIDTPVGTWVDDEGVTITEEQFLERLDRDEALNRTDLNAYMAMYEQTYQSKRVIDIPEKFEPLDTDTDGYISFDELLKVIDDYFDFKVDLSIEELRQLNEFFFEQ